MGMAQFHGLVPGRKTFVQDTNFNTTYIKSLDKFTENLILILRKPDKDGSVERLKKLIYFEWINEAFSLVDAS